MEDDLSIQEALLNDSRISSTVNGNETEKPFCTQPTGGHKWWAAVLLGLIFALVSSPVGYQLTAKTGIKTIVGQGPTLAGLLIHTAIFILIIRLILW